MKRIIFLVTVACAAWTTNVDAQTVWYVRPFAIGGGTSWSDAGDLDQMVNQAAPGDQIWVERTTGSAGPYFVNLDMPPQVELYGGFAGWETNLNQRDWINNVTVLDGSLNPMASVITIWTKASGLSGGRVDGFTIQGGNTYDQYIGGGITARSISDVVLANLIVKNNTALYGGGVYLHTISNVIMQNVRVTQNKAYEEGGGMRIVDLYGTFVDLLIDNNENLSQSGGNGRGGGAYIEHADPVFINTTFTQNTIIGNSMYYLPATAAYCDTSHVTFYNSILYPDNIAVGLPGSETYDYCIVGQQWWTGIITPSIWVLPPNYTSLFFDPNPLPAGDYHLMPGSFALDIGNNTYLPPYVMNDLDSHVRVWNGQVDLGPYEFQGHYPAPPEFAEQYTENETVNKESINLSLYPNPANEILHIDIVDFADVNITNIQICDVYGKTLIHKELSTQNATINVVNLATGVYFVHVTTDTGYIVRKYFVKQ
jgi:hypothetical protein